MRGRARKQRCGSLPHRRGNSGRSALVRRSRGGKKPHGGKAAVRRIFRGDTGRGLHGPGVRAGREAYFFLLPRTASLSAFAAVNRSLVRAGILIASPVAGLRPIRALAWRLRTMPRPARRRDPSLVSSRTTRLVSSSSAVLACFLVIPTLSARWAATCDCVIILLLVGPASRARNQPDELIAVFQVSGVKFAHIS